jgi:hypothetical protein
MVVAVLIVASGLALQVVQAQQPGIKRTDLQRHDLGIPGREVVQVRVDFAPGAVAPKHSHPGEEIVYAIEGLRGEERRQRQRGGTRHVCRRKRETARRAGQVSAQ